MFATAPATTRPARSSRGKEMMRTTRPPVVDGLSLALQAASSDTSTSTTARIQPSYAIVTDFFNGLLGLRLRLANRERGDRRHDETCRIEDAEPRYGAGDT